eukprot:COSAG01_NODE_6863_length_3465_cov_2.172608_1_plen_44_part_10
MALQGIFVVQPVVDRHFQAGSVVLRQGGGGIQRWDLGAQTTLRS